MGVNGEMFFTKIEITVNFERYDEPVHQQCFSFAAAAAAGAELNSIPSLLN